MFLSGAVKDIRIDDLLLYKRVKFLMSRPVEHFGLARAKKLNGSNRGKYGAAVRIPKTIVVLCGQ